MGWGGGAAAEVLKNNRGRALCHATFVNLMAVICNINRMLYFDCRGVVSVVC